LIGAGQYRAQFLAAPRDLAQRMWWLLLAAAICLVLSALAGDGTLRYGLAVAGLAVALVAGGARVAAFLAARGEARLARTMQRIVGDDAAPCFTTDELGVVLFRNTAASIRFGAHPAETLAAHLGEQVASPAAILFRLQSRAATQGSAREDVVTRRGHLRLSVHRVARQRFLWRLEEFQDRGPGGRGAQGLSLPMIVANKAGVILFSNEAMRRLLGERPKRLDRIFTQTRFVSGEMVQVATADGPRRAIVAEVEGIGDRREIFLLPMTAAQDHDDLPTDFEHLPVALMKFGADGNLRAANRAAREMTGDRAVGDIGFHALFEDLGRPVNDWLMDVIEGRLAEGSEVLRARGAGDEAFVRVQLRRIVEHGRAGALAILSDGSDLKKLEAQFNQSQKMQAIGQLAGGIAHDFNNLLTAISGHCDLLLLRRGREDTDYADLEQIRQNANRAAALVNQLLAYSRKQTLRPVRVDLQDVLSDLMHLLNRLVGEKVTLRLAHDPLLGPIRADRRRLEQVLMNLVVNARDAMADGGTIRIETEALALSSPQVRDGATLPAGEYAVVRVIDTGCGIPADRLDKIFEPFFTTKRVGEGTGLGLSTVYGIVKQSGGYVFVASEVGCGTTFELCFPVYDLPEAPAEPTPPREEPRRPVAGRTEGVVLLVEDEAPVRAFASRALRMRGFTVLEADCAEAALKTLEDPSLEVDVFVTDVVMPGMDGPTWVRRALEDRPGVRVVFMSGYAEDAMSEDQARIAHSVFLAKPFSLNDLTGVVQRQLH